MTTHTLEAPALTSAPSPLASEVVVRGASLTKRYGTGDIAVDALRGVDVTS